MLTANILLQQQPTTLPIAFELEGSKYHILSVLRFLPGRRNVLHVSNTQGEFVLKLFAAKDKGQREYQRELTAHQHCNQSGIAVAPIIQHAADINGVSFIVYAFLPKAVTLAQLPVEHFPFGDLFELFAHCHQSHCYQHDPHLDNFVVSNERLYLLDLASVTCEQKPLPLKTCLDNLARLMAQFPQEQEARLLSELPRYFQARNLTLDPLTERQLLARLDKARQYRQSHFLKKQFRACTMTRYQKSLQIEAAWRNSLAAALSERPIQVLESAMACGNMLKKGNSATVMLTQLANQSVVIKRYNIKHIGHFLRRCLRKSRANVSWYNANLLEYLNIATPAPLGFVEQRFFGLRGKAYFICQHIAGRSLGELSARELQHPDILQQLTDLFSQLRRHHIYHGDLKATNILVDQQNKIWLIDLDAMQQVSEHEIQRLHQRDQQRFLRNWSAGETQTALARAIRKL